MFADINTKAAEIVRSRGSVKCYFQSVRPGLVYREVSLNVKHNLIFFLRHYV